MRQETFEVADFKTKTAIWQHLEPSVRVLNNQSAEPVPLAPTLGDVIKRYREQMLSALAASTRNTQNGQLQIHIEPKWGATVLTEIHPGDAHAWIQTVNLFQVCVQAQSCRQESATSQKNGNCGPVHRSFQAPVVILPRLHRDDTCLADSNRSLCRLNLSSRAWRCRRC
jgi:hypothetical protein